MANSFHRQLAGRILLHVRTAGLAEGHHLTEASLEALLGTSRAPIRVALAHLADEGVLRRIPNRGFYVAGVVKGHEPVTAPVSEDERIYLSIADDRLSGRLGPTLNENEAMRRYAIPRTRLRRIIDRIAREGWIERREGRGWSFTPLIDSLQAYRESYELRQILEPAGLLAGGFTRDAAIMARLRAQQELIREGGWKTLAQFELFEMNSQFHEGLAEMSGNRFLLGVIARQNQLRRLIEYRQNLNREQVRGQNDEHLVILHELENDRIEAASDLLASHLERAKLRKARGAMFQHAFPDPA